MSHASSVQSPFGDKSSSHEVLSISNESKKVSCNLTPLHSPMVQKYCFSESGGGNPIMPMAILPWIEQLDKNPSNKESSYANVVGKLFVNPYAILPDILPLLGLTEKSKEEVSSIYTQLLKKYHEEYLQRREGQTSFVENLKLFQLPLFSSYFIVDQIRDHSPEDFKALLSQKSRNLNYDEPSRIKFAEALSQIWSVEEEGKDWFAPCVNYAFNSINEVIISRHSDFIGNRITAQVKQASGFSGYTDCSSEESSFTGWNSGSKPWDFV